MIKKILKHYLLAGLLGIFVYGMIFLESLYYKHAQSSCISMPFIPCFNGFDESIILMILTGIFSIIAFYFLSRRFQITHWIAIILGGCSWLLLYNISDINNIIWKNWHILILFPLFFGTATIIFEQLVLPIKNVRYTIRAAVTFTIISFVGYCILIGANLLF